MHSRMDEATVEPVCRLCGGVLYVVVLRPLDHRPTYSASAFFFFFVPIAYVFVFLQREKVITQLVFLPFSALFDHGRPTCAWCAIHSVFIMQPNNQKKKVVACGSITKFN